MTAFRFPKRRSKKAEIKTRSLLDADKKPDEEPGIINGQKARSLLEWRVAKALWAMNYTFFYQYPLFGGTRVRGGYVVDFLVDAAPNSIPLEVQGERWHTNNFASGERMREARIESYLGTKLVYVWENELKTQDDANAAVRKALR